MSSSTKQAAVWLSPHENIQTPQQLAAMVKNVYMPDHTTVVYIPTFYDDWPQQVLSQRSIGDALAIDNAADAANVRAQIEAEGVLCGGWSVPRATGDAYDEGYKQGQAAAAFDYFILNFEDGWAGFWTQNGTYAITQFLTGFWDALKAGGRDSSNFLLGLSFVTNTAMLQAVDAEEGAAWFGGVHYVCVEAYVPGDPGLDPANSLRRMQAELDAAGFPDMRVVCILERGDLVALAQEFDHPELGFQVWTVAVAVAATWPVPEDNGGDDVDLPQVDWAWQAKKDVVVSTTGELVAVRQQFNDEANRKAGPRKKEVNRLASNEMQPRLDKILA